MPHANKVVSEPSQKEQCSYMQCQRPKQQQCSKIEVFLSERKSDPKRSSNPFNLQLFEIQVESQLNTRPCRGPARGRPPTLHRRSYNRVADLAGRGCSVPCETHHSLLVSELLLLEFRPNRQLCRERPLTLDRQRYKRVAHLAGCSAPCEPRHSLLFSEHNLFLRK